MAEQLYFSRDSKLYLEFGTKIWEIPVLDGFSFSQATNQSEISLSEMQGSDGLSRRGNRVFTDSLAPAEWSFSTYVRPFQDTQSTPEHHAVEEALWAVMAGADSYKDSTTGGGLLTVSTASTVTSATPGTYTINDADTTTGHPATAVGWEIDITIAANMDISFNIVSAGTGFTTSNTIVVSSADVGGGGNITIDIDAVTQTGASFYRAVDADENSTNGPAVVIPGSSKQETNFGQSNRAVLATCNLYFVMETSTTNPMVYQLKNAAINEASIDFEVDGIATINWSGFAKEINDMQSTGNAKLVAFNGVSGSVTTDTSGANLVASTTTTNKVVLDINDGFKLGVPSATTLTADMFAKDDAVGDTDTFIRNRLTQLLVSTTDTTAFPSGSYNLTLTGGNITISNNISYLVPEELGAVNVPIEHVTGGRTANGSFTCYLTLDTDSGNNGTSVELFNDMTTSGANKGLEKVVNDFNVTFQIGGAVTNTPRLYVNIPKCHVDVPTHSVEDVISVETNFAAYTTDFNVANEVKLEYYGAPN